MQFELVEKELELGLWLGITRKDDGATRWQLKAGLAFHFGRSIKRIIRYVRLLPSNNPGRRACAALSYTDPEADGFADQLPHRAR